MPPVRIEFTVPEDTYDRIEAARGDVPRAAWIKRALEKALADETPRPSPAGREAKVEAVPTERDPGPASRQSASRPSAPPRTSRVVSHSLAKARVVSIPKGKRT